MRDVHRHCPCNGVWLCHTCHTWAHAHPFEAKGAGWIVSKYEGNPGSIPVSAHFGEVLLECDGRFNYNRGDPLERVVVKIPTKEQP